MIWKRGVVLVMLFFASAVGFGRHALASDGDVVYVSNERSGDVTVIDGGTDEVIATLPVGKRPRGIHCSPDGERVYVALSGSPRMGPGVDHARAPADKSADGIGVI